MRAGKYAPGYYRHCSQAYANLPTVWSPGVYRKPGISPWYGRFGFMLAGMR